VKNSSRIIRTLYALVGMGLLACGGGSSSSSPPPPTTGAVQLTNATSTYINEVYLSSTTASTWGPIQNSSSIAPSAAWTLTSVPPGSYDGMAVIIGSVGRYNSYSWDFPITAGTTYAATVYPSSFTGSLRVLNGATSSIVGLYVVTAGAATWGANQLPGPVQVSGAFVLNDIDTGTVDVKCVHADGSTNTGYAVGIASISYTPITCS
jgi:hypothetical protein